jgi:hypothetical protein
MAHPSLNALAPLQTSPRPTGRLAGAERLEALLCLRADAVRALAEASRRRDVASAGQLVDALDEVAGQIARAGGPTTEPAAAVADGLLGAPWDRERDLVVLLGSGALVVGGALMVRGQKRVFCLDPDAPEIEARAQGMPAVVNARSLEELEAACWWLAWPHPAAFRVRVVGEGAPLPAPVLIERLERTLRAVDQAGDEIETSSYLFLHCASNNLARIAGLPSIAPLANVFAGRPAVVVSAGPSLDKNLHLLPALAGHAVIIGINQTVRALRRVGVRPDVVVALDPQNLSYQFDGVGPGDIGALCLGASVGAEVFDVPADHHATFAASPMPEGWIYGAMGEEAGLQSGGSVATAAVQMALHMGCSPIVLVGRDLALSGRNYYASDAADGGQELAVSEDGRGYTLASMTSKLELAPPEARDRLSARLAATKLELVQVPGYYGAPVTTYPGFVFELDVLRAIVHRERGRARFINATEGGAYLTGMDHLPLSTFITEQSASRFDARAALDAALAAGDLPARRARLLAGLAEMAADMKEAARLASRCFKLSARGGNGGRPAALAETGAALDALARRHPILAVLTQRTVRDIQRRDKQGWRDLAEVVEAERALYKSLASVAEDLARRVADQRRAIQRGAGGAGP